MQSGRKRPAARLSCSKSHESLLSHWGFIGYSLGSNNYSFCNECRQCCGVAYHMTVFQIMNASDADGKHFNLSKNDCTCCCRGAAVVPCNISEKWKCFTWKPQMAPEMALMKISALMQHLTATIIKMMCICQRRDTNRSVTRWIDQLQIYVARPQRLQGSSSSILTQRVGNVVPASDKSYLFKLSNDLILKCWGTRKGEGGTLILQNAILWLFLSHLVALSI